MRNRRQLTPHDVALMRAIHADSDNFTGRVNPKRNRVDHADGAPIAVNPAALKLGDAAGNPRSFVAQFDVTNVIYYFTEASGVYTPTTAAAVASAEPTLATQLPCFVFGNSDYASGFAKLQAQFPLSGWTYDNAFIYGNQGRSAGTIFSVLDANARGVLRRGDLVLPVYATLGGDNYVAFSVVRCSQVGYGTLLDALNSDMFVLNMLRFIVPDTTAASLNQYQNNINILRLSLFGKFDSDFVSPNSFKMPENQQQNIIDIPIKKGVDKQVSLATMSNYNVSSFQWSLFVQSVEKIAY